MEQNDSLYDAHIEFLHSLSKTDSLSRSEFDEFVECLSEEAIMSSHHRVICEMGALASDEQWTLANALAGIYKASILDQSEENKSALLPGMRFLQRCTEGLNFGKDHAFWMHCKSESEWAGYCKSSDYHLKEH